MDKPVDRLAWIDNEILQLEHSKLLRSRFTRESPPVGGMVQIDGNQFINFGSNDYLGIAASEELVLAVQNTIGQLGFGSGASPLINGRGTIHRQLEDDLAEFEDRECALLFPTGYAANIGTIGSLAGKGDAIFSDELNHASIIDGCRLSGATVHVYQHQNIDALNEQLKSNDSYRRRLIVTDSLFSMDGDFAPLDEICDLAERHNTMVMVDEAHATGVFGTKGKGICELQGVEQRVDVVVGTLSKALGGVGGFVAGSKTLIEWVYNRARTYIFSTAQAEVVAAAAVEALKIVNGEPRRRQSLLENAEYLRTSLSELGFNVGNSTSQIIPIILGQNADALAASKSLLERGFFVPAIRPPSVSEGMSRLRISLSSSNSRSQITKFLDCIKNLEIS